MLALSITLAFLPANAAVGQLSRSRSGLVAKDSLQSASGQTNSSFWNFSGDAIDEGAPYSYFENSTGLWLGVQSNGNPDWAGFYAESPNSNVMLYHAILTLPYSSLPSGDFNTGLYVQTSAPFINYVTCYAQVSSSGGYYWGVEYTTGNANQALNFYEVYTSQLNKGPLTRDCTIVTNGSNVLRVYLDGQLVYSSTTLKLQMPEPFNSYLEVESNYGRSMLFANYTDFYSTLNDKVSVRSAPAGDTAEIIDSSNHVLARSNVGTNGTANIPIGQLHMPISGSVQVYDASNNQVATSGAANVWGGDVYVLGTPTSSSSSSSSKSSISSTSTSVSTSFSTTSSSSTQTTTTSESTTSVAPTTTSLSSTASSSTKTTTTATTTTSSTSASQLTVNSVDTSGNAITGYWTELYNQNGGVVSTGYTPITYSLNNGQAYSIEADSYGKCIFQHWSDGNANGVRPISITGNTKLTSIYDCGTSSSTSSSTTTTSRTTMTTTTTSSASESTTTTSSSSTTTITGGAIAVNSVNQDGQTITGYWTVLYDGSGNQAGTGYTPKTFSGLNVGSVYSVLLDSYASCTFDHWQDTGSANSERSFTATASSQTFTGVYDCTTAAAQTPVAAALRQPDVSAAVVLISVALGVSMMGAILTVSHRRLPVTPLVRGTPAVSRTTFSAPCSS